MPRKKAGGDDYSPNSQDDSVVDGEIEENEKYVDIFEFAEQMELEILYRGDNRQIHFSTFNISRPGLQLAGYYKIGRAHV